MKLRLAVALVLVVALVAGCRKPDDTAPARGSGSTGIVRKDKSGVLFPGDGDNFAVRIRSLGDAPATGTCSWSVTSADGQTWQGSQDFRVKGGRIKLIPLKPIPMDYGWYKLEAKVTSADVIARDFTETYVVVREPSAQSQRRFGLGSSNDWWNARGEQTIDWPLSMDRVRRLGAGWTALSGSWVSRSAPVEPVDDVATWAGYMGALRQAGLRCVVGDLRGARQGPNDDLAGRMQRFQRAYGAQIMAWERQVDAQGQSLAGPMARLAGEPIMLTSHPHSAPQYNTPDQDAQCNAECRVACGYMIRGYRPGGYDTKVPPEQATEARAALAYRNLNLPLVGLYFSAPPLYDMTGGVPSPLEQAGEVAGLMLQWAAVMTPQDFWHYVPLDDTGAQQYAGLFAQNMGSPKPSAAAFATVAHFLAAATLTQDASANGASVLQFNTPDGLLTAVWVTDPGNVWPQPEAPEFVTVTTQGRVTQISVTGTETPISAGSFQLRLTNEPVYFLGNVQVAVPPVGATSYVR